jgi:hypothetical protein
MCPTNFLRNFTFNREIILQNPIKGKKTKASTVLVRFPELAKRSISCFVLFFVENLLSANTMEEEKGNAKFPPSLVLLNQKCMPWRLIEVEQKGDDNIEFKLQLKEKRTLIKGPTENSKWSLSSNMKRVILPSEIIIHNSQHNLKVCNNRGDWIPGKDFDSICKGFIDKVQNLAIDTNFKSPKQKAEELQRFLNGFIKENKEFGLPTVMLSTQNWTIDCILYSMF